MVYNTTKVNFNLILKLLKVSLCEIVLTRSCNRLHGKHKTFLKYEREKKIRFYISRKTSNWMKTSRESFFMSYMIARIGFTSFLCSKVTLQLGTLRPVAVTVGTEQWLEIS